MNPIETHRFYWRYSYIPHKGMWWNIRNNLGSYWRFQWDNLCESVVSLKRRIKLSPRKD